MRMKYVVVLCDGMADEPLEELGGMNVFVVRRDGSSTYSAPYWRNSGRWDSLGYLPATARIVAPRFSNAIFL